MSRLRHSLTQLLGAWLLFGGCACEEVHEAADGGGYANDAQTPPAEYKLCDGSERVRLGYQSGGGFVDEGYEFEQPYGMQFLDVDGQCDFILGEYDAPGIVVAGHLDEQTAAELEQQLRLDQLPRGVFFDQESCPDAGRVSLATAQFYGDCSCGCDPGAPAGLERGLEAVAAALELVRAKGAALSGDVEVAALVRDAAANPGGARAWPFSWPVTDIANQTLQAYERPIKQRVLTGADAETARNLRAEVSAEKRLLFQSGSALYELYVRDRVEPELAAEIARFNLEADPRPTRPVSSCDGDPDRSVRFGSTSLYGTQLYASLESLPECGTRICWDGAFQERQPVVAPLRVVKDTRARPCLGRAPSGLLVDFTPIATAFAASYPSAKLEVELALPGWSGDTLRLTESP